MSARPRLTFTDRAPDERVAAILGIALGVTFSVCFATGVLSHLVQRPPSWFVWPSRPAGLYRVTQGLHVATGIASVPLLLAKLYVVYPKLFAWPPFVNGLDAVERISLVPLIGGGIFMLSGGIANISQWYPWPFGFRVSHYWVAWIVIGALMIHVVAKWQTTRRALRPDRRRHHDLAGAAVDAPESVVARRTFLGAVFGTSGLLVLFTVGQTVRPLERLALLAPRRPGVGPQGFPVNGSAIGAGVVRPARDPAYRLEIVGNVGRELRLSLTELRNLPQHDATLPIACVEGWSANVRWRGVRVRELLALAGAPPDAHVRVHSLEQGRSSLLNTQHAHDVDTLLAIEANGTTLHLDHGFPVRLIGPNRPGTMQTKWVSRLVVT